MPNWKKIIVSGSDASLSSAYIDGNLTASAAYLTSASIGHLETIYETASVIYSSGSTKFGDTSDDTHEITGSLLVSGNAQFVDILGVANEIVMVGSNNSLTSSTILSLDPANNYIGINQPNPEVTLHMTGDGAQTAQIRMEQYNDSADAPDIRTRKARGTSALPTAPNAGDYLFRQNVERYNGSGYSTMHSQQFDLADDDATKAVYQLQTDIGSGLADRMVIDKEGNILFTSAVTASIFTGSFVGDGSNLTGIVATSADSASVAARATTLSPNATASYADSATTASHALTAITASHALNVPDTASHALTAVTASHTEGTASFANYATSASYAISASHEITYEISSSLAETASFAKTGDGIFSGSFSGDGSGLTGVGAFPYTGSADIFGALQITASDDGYVDDYISSYIEGGIAIHTDGGIITTGSINATEFSGSYYGTYLEIDSVDDYVDDYADDYFNGIAINSNGDIILTGSIYGPYISADHFTGSFSGSFNGDGSSLTGLVTSSHADRATSASQADLATTSSHAISASYAVSASHEITYEISSSLAETASFASSGDGLFSGSFSGSFQGDGTNLSGITVFPFSGSAEITGSMNITGSLFATSVTEASALKYKQSVKTLNSADVVHKLRPVSFEWKNTKKLDIGLIAEEVAKVLPELVDIDLEGKAQGIKYSKLSALLIKSVQELTQQNQDLISRIEKLEKQNVL